MPFSLCEPVLIHIFLILLSQQIFLEHQLWARHCSRHGRDGAAKTSALVLVKRKRKLARKKISILINFYFRWWKCKKKMKQGNGRLQSRKFLLRRKHLSWDLNDKREPAVQRWVSQEMAKPKCENELDTFKGLKKARNTVGKDLILIGRRNYELKWSGSGSGKAS